jgi:polyphosphate glucokinase
VEPHNLGRGWVGFDFARAFDRPVKVVNDAAMQALGSYRGGKVLFLGLGTGLGSAMIVEGIVAPMEMAHLPLKRGDEARHDVGHVTPPLLLTIAFQAGPSHIVFVGALLVYATIR